MTGRPYPQIHPDQHVLADAELVLSGAFAPDTGFGGLAPLPPALAAVLAAEGGVVLVDDEGAGVAEVRADGSLRALAHPASGPFRSLHLAPADLPSTRSRVGVLLDRPLLRDEVAALVEHAADADVVLLVRTLDTRIPSDVLVRAVLAVCRRIRGARVVAVPLGRRGDADGDEVAAARVLANYGVRPVDGLGAPARWDAVQHALDTDDEPLLADALDPQTHAVLRRWRPRRAERGLVIFFTGLSGSGKSTVARALADRIHETNRHLTVLDGDVARRMLSAGLGFSREDRDLNIRRLGWVGAEVARHGGWAILAPIAPFAATRDEVRRMVQATGDLVLVWVATPLEECERRDRKGLYAQARRGEIPDFTGISSPYEQPTDADLVLDTTDLSVDEAVDRVWRLLRRGGWLPDAEPTIT